MRWFGKKEQDRPSTQQAAIADFWQWWAGVRDEVKASISGGTSQEWAGPFNKQVSAIHKDLEWELTPGITAQHGLVVSPGGKPELRAIAARWLAAAPPVDETWEYHDQRRADYSVFSSTLQIGPASLAMEEIRYGISVDKERHQVNVVCYHPGFVDLPEEVQQQITFLTLDWLLGENDVETWVGTIESSVAPLANPRLPKDLRHAVDAIVADDDSWVLATGHTRDGSPVIATICMPLRSARWPRFDNHLAITLPYRSYNEGQLPVDGSLQALRDFEDEVTEAIGADGTLVAHETSKRERRLHFYVDSQSAATSRAEALAPRWSEGRAGVTTKYDPGFGEVAHLAG